MMKEWWLTPSQERTLEKLNRRFRLRRMNCCEDGYTAFRAGDRYFWVGRRGGLGTIDRQGRFVTGDRAWEIIEK
jgi:hypothetical protein